VHLKCAIVKWLAVVVITSSQPSLRHRRAINQARGSGRRVQLEQRTITPMTLENKELVKKEEESDSDSLECAA